MQQGFKHLHELDCGSPCQQRTYAIMGIDIKFAAIDFKHAINGTKA